MNHSTLVALYTPWLADDPPTADAPPPSERSRRARAVVDQITANLVEHQCLVGRNPEDIPPWGLYFAYRVCGALIRAPHQTPQATDIIRTLREALRAIDVRWNVAGLYLQLLEAQEAIRLGV